VEVDVDAGSAVVGGVGAVVVAAVGEVAEGGGERVDAGLVEGAGCSAVTGAVLVGEGVQGVPDAGGIDGGQGDGDGGGAVAVVTDPRGPVPDCFGAFPGGAVGVGADHGPP